MTDYEKSSSDNLQNPDMEMELLGSLLIRNGQIIPKVNSILKPDDFSFSINEIIYQTIVNLHSRGIAPSILLIVEELRKRNDFKDNESVFLKTALSLGDVAFTNAYAEDYAKTIKEKSVRRQLKSFAEQLIRDADNPTLLFSDLLSAADSSFRSINNDSSPSQLIEQDFYFDNFFRQQVNNYQNYSSRKTGFSNIDDQQIFSPGLYVIGATPACGKTTFAWQLLNQLAESGERCIFCSYEMSALELYSKTLARELFKLDSNSTLTAADIRNGAHSESLDSVFIQLASGENKSKVALFELQDQNIDDLLRMLKPFCSDNKKSPVVCIDYLQIIPPSNDKKLISDKSKIDDIVRKLKSFQRETNTTFIVISSFNRMNYYQQVTFESFKESGNIEYTADVVWALQLNVVNYISVGDTLSQTRKKFDDAKKTQPREIQLKCLKNRQGNNYDCYFNYFSAHDFFTPATFTDFEANHPPAQANQSTQKLNNKDQEKMNQYEQTIGNINDDDKG